MKTVVWQVNRIVQEVTGTNITKTIFKKRDFDSSLHQDFLTNGEKKKRDLKSDSKETGEELSSEEEREYPKFKQSNSMNNMLPAVKDAHEQAAQLSEKRQQEQDEEPAKKRAKIEGIKKMIETQKENAKLEEELEKFKVVSQVTFDDIGGMLETKKQLTEMIEWPLKHSTVFEWLGVQPPKGILITGPPGCGKTLLALAIAGQNPEINLYRLTGPEIVSGISGQSEEKIRNFFKAVGDHAPAIVFIDELDSIAGKRENAVKDMEVRIVAQIASCMDDLSQSDKQIIVIGCTSRPETIDSALRRAGRFEREINIGVPTEDERVDIIKVLTKKMRLQPDFKFEEMVKLTPGYVGADIQTLCKEASILAVERIIGSNGQYNVDKKDQDEKDDDVLDVNKLFIEYEDFQKASKRVTPSAQREGFSTVPSTTWNDVGALINVRAEL